MSSGIFVDPEDIDSDEHGNKKGLDVQVALGTEAGAVYIMANFQVTMTFVDTSIHIQGCKTFNAEWNSVPVHSVALYRLFQNLLYLTCIKHMV